MAEQAEDMAELITRGMLREEFARFEKRFEEKIDRKFAMWGGALNDRIERGEQRLEKRLAEQERRLMTEIARCTNAILEAVRVQITVIDDKYKDLPRRVARLENRRKLKG